MQDDETLESGAPKPVAVAAPGGRVGKYEILRALGAGGMGVVWAAHDPDLDREVAIKLLRADRASPEQRTRLLREARAMARLKHPNVLTVYEVASDSGRDFIAMELVDGQSLDAWLRDKPSRRDVWDALIAAGRGLTAAHAAGVIHRDFKPHNVLRSRDGRVLVTDFGLARGSIDVEDTATGGAGDSLLDVQLTATGALLGTPAYMAPEQFDGETDARTDQFGFCVTAWEALAGTRPYSGTTIDQLREAARSGTPARDAKLPRGVRAVLERGLAPDPAKRWPDMAALLAAFERTRHAWPRRLAIAVPLVVAAGAVAAVFGLRGHTAAESCDPEQAFGSAWTPQLRAAVLAKHPELASLAPRVDAYRTNWLDRYRNACRKTVNRDASLACYGEQRDELALGVELLQRYPDDFVGARDFFDLIGAQDPCDTKVVSRPPLPRDARRDQVLAFLAKAYGTLDKSGGMIGNFDELRSEAKAIHWPPLDARLEEMIAYEAAGFGYAEVAQPAYRRAADLAHAVEDRVTEARARLGILELAADALEPTVLPSAGYDSELRDAELAVHEAGDDDRLVSVLDHLRAKHAVYAEGDLTKAIEIELKALLPLMLRSDIFDMTKLAPMLAETLCVRAHPDDAGHATQVLNEVAARLRNEGFGRDTVFLRDALYWAAWLRDDVAAAHAALDQMSPLSLPSSEPIAGRVVDTHGQPVAGARVAIWRGDMYGDRDRVFTSQPAGSVATTAADGTFHGQATDGCGVIAELGDQRSVPLVAKQGVQLVLGPTRSISGTVDAGGEPTAGIEPYALIEVAAGITWSDTVAPSLDGKFTIAGIPAAAAHVELGAAGSHWPHDLFRHVVADGTTIHWPTGDTIDVLVPEGVHTVWLLRGKVAPATVGEMMKLELAQHDVHAAAEAVGWANATRTGLVGYRAGARHAVFHDVAPGTVTACIAAAPKLRCHTTTAGAFGAAPIRDGRHWPDGTVVQF